MKVKLHTNITKYGTDTTYTHIFTGYNRIIYFIGYKINCAFQHGITYTILQKNLLIDLIFTHKMTPKI